MSSRKKARLQTEATVMASNADAEASNREIDEDVPPEWKPFLESVDFDATIVHDIVKAHDSMQDAGRQQGMHPWSLENWKVVLWSSLFRRYPGFTSEHAGMALEILEPDLVESTRRNRGPNITDGLETVLVHDLDLKACEKRIEQLFEWHDQASVREEFLAPYFALVQSSGMGKTKLLIELRKLYNGRGQKYVCKTILCLDAFLNEQDQKKFYDYMLLVDTYKDAESIVKHVWAIMGHIVHDVKESTEKVVLLFDEAQGLMMGRDASGNTSLLFRAIRWWLRKQRDRKIVAAFAGTTIALSNFFPPDPPQYGVSRNQKNLYANYKRGDADMKKLYPPFYELNTIACLRGKTPSRGTQATDPGFPQTAIYGRPMFAHYYLESTLSDKKLTEFAKRLVLSRTNYEKHLSSCYSVLGSRVQMGAVNSFHTLSTLISSGYACLVDFRQQDDIKSTPVARVSFMPDPVCATLAMRFMNENWRFGDLKGKGRKFWVEQAEKAFTTKLCLPDKADASEIFAALYMLFCGDVLRQMTDTTLSTFAVSLDKWFGLLKNCGKEPISDKGEKNEEGKSTLASKTETLLTEGEAQTTQSRAKLEERVENIGEMTSTVSFVQVCRNDFLSNSFCEAETLEYMYRAGLGNYAFKNCKAFDIYASIKVVEGSQTSYHPMLVSVKNWAKVTKGDVVGWLSTMLSFLSELRREERKPSAVCLIIMLGCSDPPEITGDGLNSRSLTPFPAADVFRVVHVDNDEFGISEAIRNLGAGSERSEIYSSHAFLACENSPKNILRKSSVNQERVNELFRALKLSTEDNDTEDEDKDTEDNDTEDNDTGVKPEPSHG